MVSSVLISSRFLVRLLPCVVLLFTCCEFRHNEVTGTFKNEPLVAKSSKRIVLMKMTYHLR